MEREDIEGVLLDLGVAAVYLLLEEDRNHLRIMRGG